MADGSMRDEDFEEEDIWAVVNEREDSSTAFKLRKSKDFSSCGSSSSSALRLSNASRMIPRRASSSHEASKVVMVQQSSAPVNIPDWSKIYGSKKKVPKNGSRDHGLWLDDGDYDDKGDHNDDGDDDDNNDDDELVPPHEWIARKLARSQISSFSVCEGIGRTLKGRDLSQVRNAILTKTGFLE